MRSFTFHREQVLRGMNVEALVLYRLAGRIELLYALKSVSSGRLSYREASERYGVSQGVLERIFRDVCEARYQLCSRVLPVAVDVVLAVVPSIAAGRVCRICGVTVLNVVTHVKRKHGDILERYVDIVRREMAEALKRASSERA